MCPHKTKHTLFVISFATQYEYLMQTVWQCHSESHFVLCYHIQNERKKISDQPPVFGKPWNYLFVMSSVALSGNSIYFACFLFQFHTRVKGHYDHLNIGTAKLLCCSVNVIIVYWNITSLGEFCLHSKQRSFCDLSLNIIMAAFI